MINKLLLIMSLLIIVTTFTFSQQNSSINGKLVTSDGEGAYLVNVSLKNTHLGTVTDENGYFKINNLSSGKYRLIFSLVGMKTKIMEIEIKENQSVDLGIIELEETIIEFEESIIVAQRLNQFAQKESEYVSRIPIKNINNPQSYSVVTKELLKEQVTTDLPSAFKSITGGGYVQSNDGNVSVYLRGFRSDVHIRNGGIAYIKAPIDPQNIERIELVKGPAALLYGANVVNIANYGGFVNKVTKQAFNGKKLELGIITGSWHQTRATLDYNTVIDKENEVYFRLNGAYNSENSFQDQGIIRDFMIAPTFSAKLTSKLNLKVNLEYNQSKRNLNFARGVVASLISKNVNSWDDLNWDYNTNYSSNEMAGVFKSIAFQFMLDYKISDIWTAKTTFTNANLFTDANYFRAVMKDESTVGRYYLQLDPRESGNTHIQQDFLNVIEGSKMENKFVAGISYSNFYDDYQRFGAFNAIDDVDINNPVIYGMTNTQFEASIADQNKDKTITEFASLGLYAFDAFTLNKQITITAGLRFDRYMQESTIYNGASRNDGYNQNALSTKFGFVYNPFNDKVSLFANYSDGLTNVAPSDNGTGEIVDWDAKRAKQFEVGTKLDFFNGRLKSTISYYNIRINNDIIVDADGISIQEGETLSRGFEIDAIANPYPGLNLVVGYTQNKATLEKVNVGSESTVGNSLTYTPETVWNFWISYHILGGLLNGIGVGFGGNHISEIYNSTNNNFGSDAYTTFDALIYYTYNNYKISLKADNILDKEYYNGYGIPQKPFNFRLGIYYSLF